MKYCSMLRNRMLADPSFLFKVGTEVCFQCFFFLMEKTIFMFACLINSIYLIKKCQIREFIGEKTYLIY